MKRIVRTLSLVGLAAAGLAIGAAASDRHVAISTAEAKDRSTNACFFPREVNGWAAGPNDTVNLRVGVKQVYQGRLVAGCPDIDWALRIGLDTKGQIAVCNGGDADILVRSSSMGPQRCMMTGIHKLTPEEVAALPKKSRP